MKAFLVARHLWPVVCLAALLPFLGAGAYAAGGEWSFTHDPRDNPELTYQENGKTVFSLGVGRAIGLWIAYPGSPQPAKEEETIEIRTAQDVFVMKGELTNDHDFDAAMPSGATYFLQYDLGVDRASTEFDNLGAKWSKFVKSLAAARQIEIRTKAGNLDLRRLSGDRSQGRQTGAPLQPSRQ
jgi:hypothetical protein